MTHTKGLTEKEKSIINIVRLNEFLKKDEIIKYWIIGNCKITFHWQSKNNMWGRFGGGWNWKLGFQAGGSTLIISLLIFDVTFRKIGRS